MDFSPADLFRSTKTGSRSSLDRVNKQISASRGTFRQKVHVGVLLATVALVTSGAIIIWSASQFKADASFSRHLLGIGIGAVLAVLVWRTDLRGISNFSTALLVIDLIVIFSPKIPGLSYTGGLGMTGWIKIPGIGLTFQPVELAKLITIFFMATLGSQYNGRIDTARDYIKLCGMLSVPFLAVVAMGDLGSGLVVLVSGAIVICMSGARREWVLSTLALLVGLVALVLALDSVFDSLLGHGGFFKTGCAGQKLLAAALNTPVSVMATASEGGAWGMALLAAYRVNRRADEKLDEYLNNRVFAKSESKIAQPEAEDVEGFARYAKRFVQVLEAEKAAVEGMK